MKTCKVFLYLIAFAGFFLSCNKQTTPEPYSDYISIQVSTIPINADSTKIMQLYIKNDSNKEFEKECIITYSLQSPDSGKYYYSEEILFNKQVPNLPNGVFNMNHKGSYSFNKDLKDLKWRNIDYSGIVSDVYIFRAQIFIKDPYSPMNMINSNTLQITKD